MKYLIVLLIIFLALINCQESSEEYLRKVMLELQRLKTISSSNVKISSQYLAGKRLSDPLNYHQYQHTLAPENSITDGHQQIYKYYFYPLKSFMDNYKSIAINDDLTFESTGTYQPSHQKQIMLNPLFMAISGFIGMAVLFMLSVLVLPRIFGEFKSRLVHDDELLNLTKTVSEAIANHNSMAMRPIRTIVGIKTKPGLGVRRRRKTQQSADNIYSS